ncbi:two-component system response regulator CreB [Sulfuriroseicoccus oceanibius]|uniref:Two-component system response regulator CreB n=1 Tax=Sulfuriroseicoccus oceanibius TaxID=2707525 RepID=A0A6B3LDC0_9BACT|nr:two-component system response regulator CreB [Sulfuriroseicoccus oceanibius]QQL45033.1 two-component system response regulator CreB [Sulfuriroseicoccus oceanibius]
MFDSTTRRRILIVEDEPSIRDNIVYSLEADGFDSEACATGGEALEKLDAARFDLVVLDVGLPDMTGFDLCRKLRESSAVPVIFLTARASEIDRVVGLEIGGDDYVTKPFSPRELNARVRAVLRRAEGAVAPAVGQTGAVMEDSSPLVIDRECWQVRYFGETLELSRYEFRLLAVMEERPGRVFSRAQLMDAAWEEPEASMERTVDTHIKSLRAKMRQVSPTADLIKTHRGIGYSLEQIDNAPL